jgi:hypothetical protein
LTTWLPPDVDSAVPGQFETDPSKASGCGGTDSGINLLHLSWDEYFFGTLTNYVSNYRFVTGDSTGRIVRFSCSGSPSLGAAETLTMSAQLSTTVPTVTEFDTDGDGLTNQITFAVETLSGEVVYIDAATKNPDETLPPDETSAPTTTAPNNAPTADDIDVDANPSMSVTFMLPASDPDGDTLTATLGALPTGWTASVVGLQVTLTPGTNATEDIDYQVEDPSGETANGTISVVVSASATTTSSSTTTTTTVPPCVISNVVIEDSPAKLSANGTGKLKDDVVVTVEVQSGYCVGLTLQYDTGGPNGQYIQNLGDAAPYQISFLSHPQGTELWSTGTKVLYVYDGTDTLLAATLLEITD